MMEVGAGGASPGGRSFPTVSIPANDISALRSDIFSKDAIIQRLENEKQRLEVDVQRSRADADQDRQDARRGV